MNTRLEGGCQVPIGSYAELTDGELWLRALVGAPDGSQMVRGERRGKPQDAEALGVSLAEELLNNGAREILAEVYNGEPLHEHTCHPPFSAGERLVSRLRALGQVAWSFPLIEFSPVASCLSSLTRCVSYRKAICSLRCRSMPWSLPMRSCNSMPLAGLTPPLFRHRAHHGAGLTYRERNRCSLPVRSGNQRSLATIT